MVSTTTLKHVGLGSHFPQCIIMKKKKKKKKKKKQTNKTKPKTKTKTSVHNRNFILVIH